MSFFGKKRKDKQSTKSESAQSIDLDNLYIHDEIDENDFKLIDGVLMKVNNNCTDDAKARASDLTVSIRSSMLASPLREDTHVLESLDEDENSIKDQDENFVSPGKDPRCTLSLYNTTGTLSEDELKALIGPDKDGGLIYSCQILPSGGKYTAQNTGAPIKPRRKMPFPITLSDFKSSVTRVGEPVMEHLAEVGYDELWDRDNRGVGQTDGRKDLESTEGARWIFSGVMNGWQGLTTLEVLKFEHRHVGGWKVLWKAQREGEYGRDPWDLIEQHWDKQLKSKSKCSEIRAFLRAPEWTSQGWSKESPGFVFWVEGQCIKNIGKNIPLTVTYGTNLIQHYQASLEGESRCERVHMISHRYAKGKGKIENPRDLLTYHSIVLLEWDHGQYCTVAEIGYLNGVGGCKGKSNWYEDKNATPYSELYRAIPSEMVLPWKTTKSEIRLHDVPYEKMEEFLSKFMKEYESPSERFLDIQHTYSHEVRLSHNSRLDICIYLLNYIRRDKTYDQLKRNCQTFAADFYGFLAGKKDVKPFHPINKIEYVNRNHFFLYESSKYTSKRE